MNTPVYYGGIGILNAKRRAGSAWRRRVVRGGSRMLQGAFRALGTWRERRCQLACLDDRLPADIGLTRSEVWGELAAHFWRARRMPIASPREAYGGRNIGSST